MTYRGAFAPPRFGPTLAIVLASACGPTSVPTATGSAVGAWSYTSDPATKFVMLRSTGAEKETEATLSTPEGVVVRVRATSGPFEVTQGSDLPKATLLPSSIQVDLVQNEGGYTLRGGPSSIFGITADSPGAKSYEIGVNRVRRGCMSTRMSSTIYSITVYGDGRIDGKSY